MRMFADMIIDCTYIDSVNVHAFCSQL